MTTEYTQSTADRNTPFMFTMVGSLCYTELTGNQLKVYLYYKDMAGRFGNEGWAKRYHDVAKILGIGKKTVQRAITSLVEKGYAITTNTLCPSGDGKYIIRVHCPNIWEQHRDYVESGSNLPAELKSGRGQNDLADDTQKTVRGQNDLADDGLRGQNDPLIKNTDKNKNIEADKSARDLVCPDCENGSCSCKQYFTLLAGILWSVEKHKRLIHVIAEDRATRRWSAYWDNISGVLEKSGHDVTIKATRALIGKLRIKMADNGLEPDDILPFMRMVWRLMNGTPRINEYLYNTHYATWAQVSNQSDYSEPTEAVSDEETYMDMPISLIKHAYPQIYDDYLLEKGLKDGTTTADTV